MALIFHYSWCHNRARTHESCLILVEGEKMKEKKGIYLATLVAVAAKKNHSVVGSIWNDRSIRRNHVGLSHCNAKG